MKHEIQIGEVYDQETKSYKPKQTYIITDEQRYIIEMFADVKKDNELQPIYKINDCEFKLIPHF